MFWIDWNIRIAKKRKFDWSGIWTSDFLIVGPTQDNLSQLTIELVVAAIWTTSSYKVYLQFSLIHRVYYFCIEAATRYPESGWKYPDFSSPRHFNQSEQRLGF